MKKNSYVFKKARENFLISDIAAYSETQILNDNDCVVYVGIDSQYFKKYNSAYFAIVVAYHYGAKFNEQRIGRGIHYVFHDFVDKTLSDKSERLRRETEYLMAFASYLVYEKQFTDFNLELDYNSKEESFSYRYIDYATNYAKSIGIQSIITKPDSVACKAADNVVRSSFRGISKIESLKKYLGG